MQQTETRILRPHISLDVQNIDRSVEFYSALFGITPSKLRDDYAKFEVQDPPLNFALNLNSNVKRGNLNHLGLEVRTSEEVTEAQARLHRSGLATFDELNVDCCYALQDKIWVHDPDGNPWEIFTVKAHTEGREHGSKPVEGSKCCVPLNAVEGEKAAACC